MDFTFDTSGCTTPVNMTDKWEGQTLLQLVMLARRIEAGGELADETIREWFVRIRIIESIDGGQFTPFIGDVLPCLQRFVGLRLNATATPRNQWLAAQLAGVAERANETSRIAQDEFDDQAFGAA